MLRPPAVAGAFYPGEKESLTQAIKQSFAKGVGLTFDKSNKKDIFSAVAPHAGYVYSGPVASFTFGSIATAFTKPPLFVILGPNHTGYGSPVSMSTKDWATPLGVVKNNKGFAELVKKHSKFAGFDDAAHEQEHSIEVQLPFLQFVYGSNELEFVPVCMMAQDHAAAEDLAKAIHEAEKESGREVFVLASSDFTHFESEKSASEKDHLALKALEELDVAGFERVKLDKRASICGYGPIMVAAEYAKLKGAKKARVLKYATSGEVTGDYSNVVAYCSIIFPRG